MSLTHGKSRLIAKESGGELLTNITGRLRSQPNPSPQYAPRAVSSCNPRGPKAPHPRHWQALARLVGVSQDCKAD